MNNLVILDKEKYLMKYIEQYIFASFPKADLGLKIKIESNMYDLIENTIRANINIGNIRNKYQKEVLVNISLLDFYFGVIYDKQIIIKKRFLTVLRILAEIERMVKAWMGNEESK